MAFYAVELGKEFGVPSEVVSLANKGNWSIRISRFGNSASDLWDMFGKMLGKNSPLCRTLFWQDFPELIQDKTLGRLSHYVTTHPCLQTEK